MTYKFRTLTLLWRGETDKLTSYCVTFNPKFPPIP